jgi:hypothetical protein
MLLMVYCLYKYILVVVVVMIFVELNCYSMMNKDNLVNLNQYNRVFVAVVEEDKQMNHVVEEDKQMDQIVEEDKQMDQFVEETE